jgi:cell division protein YceG involved in septum cleavage
MKKILNQYSYAILLIVLSCSLAFLLSLRFDAPDEDQYIKIKISEGDSLWKISKQYTEQHSLSNDEFVSWVKQHNDIDGDQIYPGEEIFIPISQNVSFPTELASAAGE